MSIYAKLKDADSNGKPITIAFWAGTKILYPGKDWVRFEDQFLSILESNKDVEILNQEEMNKVIEDENKRIEDLVCGQWKQVEKRLTEITDKSFLKKVENRAIEKGKNKVAEIAKDRIEEL